MMKNHLKRIAAALSCLSLVLACAIPCSLYASETPSSQSTTSSSEEKIVRVGWYQSDMFQIGFSDDEPKSGYSYEYLKKISQYNGWTYEYVYGDWSDLLEKLRTGEIDVMACVSDTPEREEYMSFPDYVMGTETYRIYQHTDNESLDPSDLSTFDGKTIGAVNDNLMTTSLEEWIAENDVDVNIVYFDGMTERDDAFSNGEVDAIVATDNNVLNNKNYSSVVRIGESPYYLAVTKDREDLLVDLNSALALMDEVDPYFLENLQSENYGATLTSMSLTDQEQEWLDSHDTLVLGYLDDELPYCATDSKGNASGLITDVMSALMNELKISDALSVEYRSFSNYDDMIEALQNGQIDAAFPVSNGWNTDQRNIDESSAVVAAGMNLVGKHSYDSEGTQRFAINTNNTLQRDFTLEHFADAELVECDSIQDCIDAVYSGDADYTIVDGMRVGMLQGDSKYDQLSVSQLQENDSRCIGVKHGNASLLLLLNRGIKTIGSDYGLNAGYSYMDQTQDITPMQFARTHLGYVFGVIAAFVAILVLAFALYLRGVRRAHQETTMQLEKNKELNGLLQENKVQLEDSISEQEAQIEEIKALNEQLEEASAEQEAQIEEISTLNKELEEASCEKQARIDELEVASEVHDALGSGDWQMAFDETGAMSSCTWSDHFRDLIGFESLEDFPDKLESWSDRLHPEDKDRVLACYWKTVNDFTGAATYDVRYRLLTKQDGYRWYRATGRLARFDDGRPKKFYGMFLDINDQVLHERELSDARKAADAANEAKSAFLFNMSHDIRTPMNAIIGYTDLIQKHYDDKERCMDYLEKTQQSNQFLLSLINDVLEMARIESGKAELELKVNPVGGIAREVSAIFEDQMKAKGIKYTSRVETFSEWAFYDEAKIREVYLNILSNALKYTPEGGMVTLLVDELPSEQPGMINMRAVFSDTGIGMSEEFLPHLFENFAREVSATESHQQGTGLGMPIVKKILDLMGGSVEVESEQGRGTTFTVTYPLRVEGAMPAALQENDETYEFDFSGKRILLAEDNDLNAEIAIEILGEAGFELERAEDGDIAVEMVEKTESGYYDAILMDIQMPRMNGYEATRAIRSMADASKAGTPILAMTANAFEEDKREALRNGMDGHISKPVNVRELMQILAGVLQ